MELCQTPPIRAICISNPVVFRFLAKVPFGLKHSSLLPFYLPEPWEPVLLCEALLRNRSGVQISIKW